jgi:hypothetical protein
MSEALIFGFGSILFIATTAATLSFGFRRVNELRMEDLAESGRQPITRPDGLTELHVAREEPEGREASAVTGAEAGDAVD